MTKVLLVTRPIAPPWDEASKNFAYTLAKNFGLQENLELHLMTRGILPELPKNIIQENIYTSSQNDFTFTQKIRSLFFQLKNRNKFDISHYFFTPTKLNSFVIKNFIRNNKTKIIQTVATLREDLYSDEKLKSLIFGDLIITYSDYAKNKLNSLGFNNAKRIYPGIDLNYYSPAPEDDELLVKYKLKATDFIVTYPGEYTRLGATDDIVNMIILLCHSERSVSEVEESNLGRSLDYARDDKFNNIKFVFACRIKNDADRKKKEEVMKKLEENNCLDRVIFTDTVFDVAKIYNMSDVIIFPVQNMKGKFDVPLAAIEPMACEKPVIISDLLILQEFAKPEHSVIIEKGNIEQLKNAILDLYGNPEKRTLLGKNARKFVEENFNIKKIAEEYKKIYNEL